MSIAVMTEVWKDAPVTGTELLMLLALADSANDDRECWPSVRHLCKKTRLSDRQVRKLLTKLCEQKLICKAVQGGKGAKGRESNLYTILSMTPVTDDKGASPSTPVTDDKSTPVTDDSLNHHTEPSLESSPSGGKSSKTTPEKKPRPINKNAPWHDELLKCFGLTPETVTSTGDKTYWVAAADLAKINFPVERISELHAWCEDQDWPNFTVMALAKHAGEWLAGEGDDDDPYANEIFDYS